MMMLKANGHSMLSVCDLVGISRQAYFKRLSTINSKGDLYNVLEGKVIDNRKQRSGFHGRLSSARTDPCFP